MSETYYVTCDYCRREEAVAVEGALLEPSVKPLSVVVDTLRSRGWAVSNKGTRATCQSCRRDDS